MSQGSCGSNEFTACFIVSPQPVVPRGGAGGGGSLPSKPRNGGGGIPLQDCVAPNPSERKLKHCWWSGTLCHPSTQSLRVELYQWAVSLGSEHLRGSRLDRTWGWGRSRDLSRVRCPGKLPPAGKTREALTCCSAGMNKEWGAPGLLRSPTPPPEEIRVSQKGIPETEKGGCTFSGPPWRIVPASLLARKKAHTQ